MESRNQAAAQGASLEAGASPLKLHRVDLKIPNHQKQSQGLAITQEESVESGLSALGGGRSPASRHQRYNSQKEGLMTQPIALAPMLQGSITKQQTLGLLR